MCRWMAWHGQPVLIDELLFKTQHGIVDQSLHSRMGAEPTNGDGFGVGWYGAGEGRASTTASLPPGATRTCASSPRTSSRRCSWCTCGRRSGHRSSRPPPSLPPRARLFVHNGYVGDFQAIRRDLMLAIEPKLFAGIVGSTDTEVVFRLALTFGLEEDPIRALERTVGLIEATATERGVAPMVQGTFGVSDGNSLWAVRYATEGWARSLFASADVDSLHRYIPTRKCGSRRRRPMTG